MGGKKIHYWKIMELKKSTETTIAYDGDTTEENGSERKK